MKLLVLNGPNLNMLGIREPDVYGKSTYKDLVELCKAACDRLNVEVEFFQSNHEGALVDAIQAAYGNTDGIIFNPAAYTHTSVAILDAVKAVSIPTIEVHISAVETREDFRQVSFIRKACLKTISGEGFDGYVHAINDMISYLTK